MSHEISESFNDPFLNNITPRSQFRGEPGVCQRNLETGDPVEVLAHPAFPMTLPPANRGAGAMVHPASIKEGCPLGQPSFAVSIPMRGNDLALSMPRVFSACLYARRFGRSHLPLYLRGVPHVVRRRRHARYPGLLAFPRALLR